MYDIDVLLQLPGFAGREVALVAAVDVDGAVRRVVVLHHHVEEELRLVVALVATHLADPHLHLGLRTPAARNPESNEALQSCWWALAIGISKNGNSVYSIKERVATFFPKLVSMLFYGMNRTSIFSKIPTFSNYRGHSWNHDFGQGRR